MKKVFVVVGAVLLVGLTLAIVGCQGPAGSQEPATQNLSIRMGEGEVVQEVQGKEELTGEFHRWEPEVLVVHKGDKVALTVANPRSRAHSFVLPDFGVATPRLEARTGKATVEFTADKAGVFQFACGLAPDEAAGNCDPDHQRQVGYLIVLDQ